MEHPADLPNQENKPMPKNSTVNKSNLSGYLWIGLAVVVLLGAIGFLLFKTDRTGMIHDESVCVFQFANTLENVWTNYRKAGNHILNSFFMYLSLKWFKGYEHCVRIPSAFSGIVFMCSITWLMIKTVRIRVLLPAAVAMILLSRYVFNYAFLSRGYAYALGSIYLYLTCVYWLTEHKISFRFWWIPVLIFSLLNILALGAMLTTVLMLAALNLCVILFACPKFYKDSIPAKKTIFFNFTGITLLSGLGSFLVYRQVLGQMSETLARDPSPGLPFFPYMEDMITKRILNLNIKTPLQQVLPTACWMLLSLALFVTVIWAIHNRRRLGVLFREFVPNFEFLAYAITLASILVIFIFNVILKKPLGYARNQVFLIPMVMFSLVLLFDHFLYSFKYRIPKGIFTAAVIVLCVLITWNNFPHTHYAIGPQSISAPLLRDLRSIDPDRTWKLSVTHRLSGFVPSFSYYQLYGYKFQWTHPNQADVYINRPWWEPTDAPRLHKEFYEDFWCSVLVLPSFPKEHVILEYQKKEESSPAF